MKKLFLMAVIAIATVTATENKEGVSKNDTPSIM